MLRTHRWLPWTLAAVAAACSDSTGPKCAITGVTIAQNGVEMTVGETVNVPATIAQSGCGTLPALEWSSSNTQVATVTTGGAVTALAVGNTTITARLAGRAEQASVGLSVRGRVLSIGIQPGAPRVPVTGTLQLTADLSTDPGTPTGVRWRSSDPTRATVSATGLVSGLAAGTTTITAIADADTTRRATASLTVIPRVTGLQVRPEVVSLLVTETRQLSATVAGDSGVATAVTWRSANPAIASVNDAGLVTAVGAGQVQVTAISSADTTRRASANVTVIPRVAGVAVTPATGSLLVASTLQLSATVTGDPGVATTVTWRSSDPARATVDANGRITGVGAGVVTISARATADTTRSASATITVVPRVTGVTANPALVANLLVGGSLTLAATVNGDPGVSQAVTWRTSDATKVTVSAAGVIAGIATGSASIVVTSVADTTRSATVPVNVVQRVTAVNVTPQAPSINVGATVQMQAAVTGDAGVNTAVTWSSATPAVATVSSTGVVTGVSVGSAVIRATSVADPTKSGTSTVSVVVAGPQAGTAKCLAFSTEAGFGPPLSSAATYANCIPDLPGAELSMGLAIPLGVLDVNNLVLTSTMVSSNPAVASVTQAGATTWILRGLAEGAATVTATSATGSFSFSFTVVTIGGNQRVAPRLPFVPPPRRTPR